MIRFLLVSVTGWLAVLGVGIEAAMPYLFRNFAPRPSAGSFPARSSTLHARMWPHYWLGYALVILVMTHTWFVMGPLMGRSDPTGVWAATLALCLLFLQVVLGLALKSGSRNQRQLRQWHFAGMIGFIALVLIHLWKNG